LLRVQLRVCNASLAKRTLEGQRLSEFKSDTTGLAGRTHADSLPVVASFLKSKYEKCWSLSIDNIEITAMERELKLQVTAGRATQLLHAPSISRLTNGSAHTEELVSTYFDTPAMDLRGNGASLRVRATGEQPIQTLTLDGSMTAGLFEWDEFECVIDGDVPDLEALLRIVPKSSRATDILTADRLAQQLQPLFLTRIDRCAALVKI
jgi:hypothetical protein